MASNRRMALRAGVSGVLFLVAALQGLRGAAHAQATPAKTIIDVGVDSRVEMLGILCRLAGTPEFKGQRGPSDDYGAKVEKWFKPFVDHQAVRLAGRYTGRYGIAREALTAFAAHLGPAPDFAERVPFDRKDGSFDQRLKADDARRFRGEIAAFAKESNFAAFFAENRNLYDQTALRLAETLRQVEAIAWVATFFGESGGRVVIAPSLLDTWGDYAPVVRLADGSVERWRVLGKWTMDVKGQPTYGQDLPQVVLEETARASVESAVEKSYAALKPAAEKIYEKARKRLEPKGVRDARALVVETLALAAAIRHDSGDLENDRAQEAAGRASLAGLPWAAEVAELLKAFAADRGKYPTIAAFMPEIVKFLESYAAKDLSALDAARLGPIGAVLDDFAKADVMTMVLSDVADPPQNEALGRMAAAAREWHEKKLKQKGVALTTSDDLADEHRTARVLLAYGTPRTNGVIFEALKKLAMNVHKDFIDIGGKRFEGQNLCLIAAVPCPFDRSRPMLIFAGADEKDVYKLHDAEYGATDFVVLKCTGEGKFRLMKQGNLRQDGKGRLELVD